MSRWTSNQSTVNPGFWVSTPRVPGGMPRVMVIDDQGNLVPVVTVQFAVFAANSHH